MRCAVLYVDDEYVKSGEQWLFDLQTEYGEVYDCVDFYDQPAFDHPLLKDHKHEYRQVNFHNVCIELIVGELHSYGISIVFFFFF